MLACHPKDFMAKRKLEALWKQANERCPRFSAMGFFDVNHALIFTFVNMTISYVIVIIQTHQHSDSLSYLNDTCKNCSN